MSERSDTGKIDIARAWKDEEYRNSLTPEQLASLPPNPSGETELDEEELGSISGGANNVATFDPGCKFIQNGGKQSPF